MSMCKGCLKSFSDYKLLDKLCPNCSPTKLSNEEFENRRIEYEKQQETTSKENENFKLLEDEKIKSVLLTNEIIINEPIEKRFGIVSSQCIFGLNIFKDLFTLARDIVGGRILSLEEGLEEATELALNELKQKAYSAGGNAVIGVKIEHTYNNANNGSILSVFATGTVVKIANTNN